MIQDKTIEKIGEIALWIDWNIVFGGRSRGNHHLERVQKISEYLRALLEKKGEKINHFAVTAGAWLHDVGLINGNSNHAERGRHVADAILRTLKVAPENLEATLHCIETHDSGLEGDMSSVHPVTIEAKIVHDADTIDKMGPLGIVRHTWKLSVSSNPTSSPEEILNLLSEHLPARKLCLRIPEAVELATRLDFSTDSFLNDGSQSISLITQIIELARKGVPAESVCDQLKNQMEPEFARILFNQLELNHFPVYN